MERQIDPLIGKAYSFAKKAHHGQLRRGGSPYFSHVYDVFMRVSDNPDERIVALLHDVIEDSGVTEADLFNEGFSFEQVKAILTLSKKRGKHIKII